MSFRKIGVGALLSAAMVFGVSESKAEDHTFNGSICYATAPATVNQYGMGNSGNPGAMSAICPLVFDYTPGGALMSSALATVYDRSSVADVSCNLIVTDLNGDTLFSATRSTAGTTTTGPINLRWSSIGPTSGAFGVLSCTIPASTSQGISHLTTYSLH